MPCTICTAQVLVTSMEGGNHNADSATWTMAQATSANT